MKHGSKLNLPVWAFSVYLMNVNLKDVSPMKLYRELGITQRTAWYFSHRIRSAFDNSPQAFKGPVEVDETFVGGKKKGNLRNGVEKPVVGVKDRATKRDRARVMAIGKKLQEDFLLDGIEEEADVYSDGCIQGIAKSRLGKPARLASTSEGTSTRIEQSLR